MLKTIFEFLKGSILTLLLFCLSNKSIGQNFGNSNPIEHRARVLNSFLYKGIDMFYLNDATIRDAKYKELNAESKRELENLTKDIFFSLKREYKRKRENLQGYLEQEFPKNLKINLFLKDNMLGAKTQSVKSGYRVDMGYTFIRDNFEACLITSFTGLVIELRKAETSDSSIINRAVTYRDIINSLNFLHKTVVNTNPTVTDFFGDNFTALASSMIAQSYFADAVENFDNQFYGTIVFSLAHEFGHSALNSLKKIDTIMDGNWYRNEELKADKFATYLLTNSYMITGVKFPYISNGFNGGYMAFIDTASAKEFLGYSLFFNATYDLTFAGITGSNYEYPKPEQRLEVSNKAFYVAYKQFRKHVMKKADRIALISSILQQPPHITSKTFHWLKNK